MANDRDTTIEEFGNAVNMTRKELGDWLKTDESRGVGQKRAGDDESTGHESGRMIVKLLAKKQAADHYSDDVQQMRRVVSYVHRHRAQRTNGDVEDIPWRYSLMNWGTTHSSSRQWIVDSG